MLLKVLGLQREESDGQRGFRAPFQILSQNRIIRDHLFLQVSLWLWGLQREMSTCGEPAWFLKNISEKSGTKIFQIKSDMTLYIISIPFTLKTGRDNKASPPCGLKKWDMWSPLIWFKKKKKVQRIKFLYLISSWFKIAGIPTGQFSNRTLLLKVCLMHQHQLEPSQIWRISGSTLDLQNQNQHYTWSPRSICAHEAWEAPLGRNRKGS